MTQKQSKKILKPSLSDSKLTLLESTIAASDAAVSQYEDDFASISEIAQNIVDDLIHTHDIAFVFLEDIEGFMWTKNGIEITEIWAKDTQVKHDLCAVSALLWRGLPGHEVWRTINNEDI